MNKKVILLVEDESDLAFIIRDTLSMLDYRLLIAADGEEALKCYREHRPDIVVTDVMMPRMDGFTFVRRLRAFDKNTPIIFLTARTETDDVVSGFKMGANDYLRKPFSMRELIVRIEALLARSDNAPDSRPAPDALQKQPVETEKKSGAEADENTEPTDRVAGVGGFVLHADRQNLTFNSGNSVTLTYRESEILYRLFRFPGKVVTSHELLLELWGQDTACNARSLHVFISKLRTKLSQDPSIRIFNVHGVGYKLSVEH